jgi:hypothetical protein
VNPRSSLVTLFGVILLATLSPSAFADKIQDFIDQPVSTKANGQKFTPLEVQSIIIKACTVRKWVPRVSEPGKLSVNILVRGVHYAEVSIPFNDTTYSILYVTSRELDANEKKRKIHGNYNKWVGALNAEIGRAFALAISAN